MKIPYYQLRNKSSGFSLIEVTIAMAIASVALVSLLGMIPQGMDTMREAGDQAIMGRIHQQILNELQMTPFEDATGKDLILDAYGEDPAKKKMEFYYDSQGEELSDSKSQGSVPEERKKGSFAHIYTARVTFPEESGAPDSIGGAKFDGYAFDGGEVNPFVKPVVLEIAAVGGNGKDFKFDEEKNRSIIKTFQSIIVKLGQAYK